jgi:hypothetical protein
VKCGALFVSVFMALLAGLSGCATADYVAGPDGYPAIYVRCSPSRIEKCHMKAERICPYGYQLVAPPGYGQLLVRCN